MGMKGGERKEHELQAVPKFCASAGCSQMFEINLSQVRSDRARVADEVERAAADRVAHPDQRHHHAARRPRLPHAPQERVHASRPPRRPRCK